MQQIHKTVRHRNVPILLRVPWPMMRRKGWGIAGLPAGLSIHVVCIVKHLNAKLPCGSEEPTGENVLMGTYN